MLSEVREQAPDAEATLYVSREDGRFVTEAGTTGRQIHYYSRSVDRTYVVDENTGKVVLAYATRDMPEAVVVVTPPEPEESAPEPEESAPEPEGCGPGCGDGCGCGVPLEPDKLPG
jgi:hypothetical protein